MGLLQSLCHGVAIIWIELVSMSCCCCGVTRSTGLESSRLDGATQLNSSVISPFPCLGCHQHQAGVVDIHAVKIFEFQLIQSLEPIQFLYRGVYLYILGFGGDPSILELHDRIGVMRCGRTPNRARD
jgi:hypothetical protein